MQWLEYSANWELLSNMMTVFGLPFALAVFVYEQRRERESVAEAGYQMLSDAYTDFLKLVIDNPDLKLRSRDSVKLTEEQHERRLALYEILISLLERAYLLAHKQNMKGHQLRRWHSWEDYMTEWCHREDFRKALPTLLKGEDENFAEYYRQLIFVNGYTLDG